MKVNPMTCAPSDGPIKLVRLLAGIGAVSLLGACASMGMGTPEEIVAHRAKAYWDARIEGKPAKAYGLTNAAYQLSTTEKQFSQQYANTFAVGATVKNVKCEPQKCEVGINLDTKPPVLGQKLGTIAMYSTQTWLLEDGQWRLYMEP